MISNLKRHIVVDVDSGFLHAVHYCVGKAGNKDCLCDGVSTSHCYTSIIASISPKLNILNAACSDVALNRWGSVTPLLACVTFTIMIAALGPCGWISAWPSAYCNALEKQSAARRCK